MATDQQQISYTEGSSNQGNSPTYDQSSSSSGGMDMISSIIASGVDTGALITEGIFFKLEQEAADEANEEARRLAMMQRSDQLRQNAISNRLARDQQDLQEANFNFGRQRWGKEFALNKQQYADAKKQMQIDRKQQGFDKLATNIARAAQYNQTIRNDIMSRFAA